MPSREKIKEGYYYHLFNRGNNETTLFSGHKDYISFLNKYALYCFFVLDTYAYCLLNNHFHLLVRTRTREEQQKLKLQNPFSITDPERVNPDKILNASKQLSHLFNSHAQSMNKKYNRTGSLFEKPFHRKSVSDEHYFSRLVCYIHWNSQLHGLVKDFRTYPYSSYGLFMNKNHSRLNKKEVLNCFGGLEGFNEAHRVLPKGLSREFMLETRPKHYRK
ncbi:MAG TPA: hypothetical protein VJ905_01185 [Halalkalibaculum sp.]|nr:hypothetical protein [Halalkalibaculum sp.]